MPYNHFATLVILRLHTVGEACQTALIELAKGFHLTEEGLDFEQTLAAKFVHDEIVCVPTESPEDAVHLGKHVRLPNDAEEERHLAKRVALVNDADRLVIAKHRHLAIFNHVKVLALAALRKDLLALFHRRSLHVVDHLLKARVLQPPKHAVGAQCGH